MSTPTINRQPVRLAPRCTTGRASSVDRAMTDAWAVAPDLRDDIDWSRAACHGRTRMMFSNSGARCCAACPMPTVCLADAIRTETGGDITAGIYGYRGGVTGPERGRWYRSHPEVVR